MYGDSKQVLMSTGVIFMVKNSRHILPIIIIIIIIITLHTKLRSVM